VKQLAATSSDRSLRGMRLFSGANPPTGAHAADCRTGSPRYLLAADVAGLWHMRTSRRPRA
jgi:hypothetical protein